MSTDDEKRIGSAAYYNALARAGVSFGTDSSGGVKAKRVVVENGVSRIEEVGNVRQTLTTGQDGRLTPALETQDGSTIVVETSAPGRVGELSKRADLERRLNALRG